MVVRFRKVRWEVLPDKPVSPPGPDHYRDYSGKKTAAAQVRIPVPHADKGQRHESHEKDQRYSGGSAGPLSALRASAEVFVLLNRLSAQQASGYLLNAEKRHRHTAPVGFPEFCGKALNLPQLILRQRREPLSHRELFPQKHVPYPGKLRITLYKILPYLVHHNTPALQSFRIPCSFIIITAGILNPLPRKC